MEGETMENKISIAIADDHPIVAQGIAEILRNLPQIAEVRIFHDGEELYRSCMNKQPHLVFLDIEMPHWDGIQTLEKINQNFPKITCMMLSMVNDKYTVQKCIQIGAKGFVSKNSTSFELQDALEAFQNKTIFYSPEIKEKLEGKSKNSESSNEVKVVLSSRELEILQLLCEGFSPREIADKLFLSPRTVETHKNNIMQKVGVNTIGKLISTAIRSHLVS